MSIQTACGRYFQEVSQFNAAPDIALVDFLRICDLLGKDKLISEITNDDVATAVAKRRGHKVKKTEKYITNGTVNKSFTKRLSAVMNRASDIWGINTNKILWRNHLLKEPQERIRELTIDEERLFDHIRDDYLPLIEFKLLTGRRVNELLTLAWRDIDWGNREYKITGKGDKTRKFPLTDHLLKILKDLPRANHDHVFTYVVQKGRDKGSRRPITYSGFKMIFKSARKSAGIEDFRIHDLRHTFATRILREKDNLKLVQELLNHSDIGTTVKYAHVQTDDLRDAMESISIAPKSPTKRASVTKNPAKSPAEKRKRNITK